MTSFLKIFLDSENLFQNDSDKRSFKDIKREILYLRKYTEAFVEYKFLLNLKKSLIAANKVSDTDIPAFYKWVLYKLYLENKSSHSSMKNFFELREEKKVMELEVLYESAHNLKDCSMIDGAIDLFKKYLEKQTTYSNNRKEEKARFSVIFENKKMLNIEKAIIKYFLYKNGALKLVNEDTFFEDYFHEINFIEPQKRYLSEAIICNPNSYKGLYRYWLGYYASLRVHLFSDIHNVKKITGYNSKPLFKGKSEYNYFELKRKIEELNLKLDKELNKIFHSEWLKSILLDSIFTTTGISFDISAELKSTILN